MILLIMDDCGRNLYPFELTEIKESLYQQA